MKKLNEKVLAHGEVTGHAHRVGVDVFEDDDGTRRFVGKTIVTHEEHKQIEIPDGKWASGRIIEYDHFAEEAREVRD